MRWLVGLVLFTLAAVGEVYYIAGRGAPPVLRIDKPERVVGQAGTLEVVAESPRARLTTLTITVEQNGHALPLFSLDGAQSANITQVDPNRIRVSRPFGKQSVPELQSGTARIVVAATRKSFLNLRTLSSTTSRDIQVRLEPPRIAVVSTHHYVNHGGSEMLIYRATPSDVASGVRVGEVEYPGFPASGAGISDLGLSTAFFALLHDQDLNTPIVAFARDEAGNEAKASFVDNVFQKPQKRSRIELDDAFVNRVVPEILAHSPELKIATPAQGDDMLPAFLKINGELRRINAGEIAALASKTTSKKLWEGPFVQLGNSQVEASFSDHRTYFHKGKDVDQQVHLGFDLAVTSRVAIVAANAGNVVNARWLGIFGNCVIIDHGMGVQSLYGHLSSLDVKVGETVTKGQTIGRSGMTGLAAGDHLHFTMLVNGHPVNPVEWWDPHWIQDRVERKLGEAGAPATGDGPLARGSAEPLRKENALSKRAPARRN
jgi:murein DD-endopeptidase MepM/ murein hydrolase activator NlpD